MPAAIVSDQSERVRRIGPIGTWSRVLAGVALGVVGFLGTIHPTGIAWYKVVLGLVALPVLMVLIAIVVGHYRSAPLRLTGPLGTGINCLVIVGLTANPITGPTVELFYGATLLVAAWRAQPGCEATVVPNSILGRDDQIGCPLFSPIDRAERRRQASATRRNRRGAARVTPTRRGDRPQSQPPQSGVG